MRDGDDPLNRKHGTLLSWPLLAEPMIVLPKWIRGLPPREHMMVKIDYAMIEQKIIQSLQNASPVFTPNACMIVTPMHRSHVMLWCVSELDVKPTFDVWWSLSITPTWRTHDALKSKSLDSCILMLERKKPCVNN